MGSGSAKKCGAGAAGWSAVLLCTIFTAFSIYFGRDVSTVCAAEEWSIPQPSSAKIYSGMSEDSDVIANLIVGNGFEVAGAENDDAGGVWYRVRADFGAEGYVKAGEMDRLIADAQAMLPQITADADREPPAPADDSAGEPSDPENTDGGEASAEAPPSGDDSAGDTPVQAEDNAGEEQVSEGSNAEEGQDPAEDNVGEGQAPEDSNAEEGQDPAEDHAGEGQAPEGSHAGEGQDPAEGDIAGAETIGGQAQVPPGETAADPVDGAGFGRETDDSAAESMVIGSEGFTVIERTDNQAVRRHGGIDGVLAMIIAGGILCITAIAALLRSAMKCVRTEV